MNKEEIKNALKEIILHDNVELRDLVKEVVREILSEEKQVAQESVEDRRKRLESFIDEDFDNYDKVFKALA